MNQTVTRTDGSDPLINQTHTYYDDGRVAGVTDYLDSAYTTSYAYDDVISGGLAAVSIGGSYTRSYGYDLWGNMTAVSSNSEPSVTYNYAANASGAPATNRLQSVTTGGVAINYGYDAAGNLTQEGALGYSYDAANRLKEVGTGGNNTYGYDGDGHRVKKVESGSGAIYYVWSSVTGQVAMEVNSQGGVYRAYVYAGMSLAGVLSYDGQFYWVHQDRLGSGRKLTDSSGAVRYRAEFDPFGQMLLEWSNPSGVTNLNSHKFTGYERDEATGLDNAGARMYHSARGRFIQPDPMGLQAVDLSRPQSLNRYSYVQNDPVNYVDPGGLFLAVPPPLVPPPPTPDPGVGPVFGGDSSFLIEDNGSGAGDPGSSSAPDLTAALNGLDDACKGLLAKQFGGKFEDALAFAAKVEMIDYNSAAANEDMPAMRKTYKQLFEDGAKALGGLSNAQAIARTIADNTAPGGYKFDFKVGNTIVFSGAVSNAVLAHEFFHIAYNMDDLQLAGKGGLDLDYTKILKDDNNKDISNNPQAQASIAIQRFIEKKCQK